MKAILGGVVVEGTIDPSEESLALTRQQLCRTWQAQNARSALLCHAMHAILWLIPGRKTCTPPARLFQQRDTTRPL